MRLFLRTLAITICFALSNASVQAQVITAEHAQEIADSFFSNGMKRSAAARTAVSLAKSADSSILTRGSSNEAPTFHIISNPDGKGFVIVSGEEIENPIIGYSFDSEFTADGEMPTGLADYLSDIDAQVKALRKYNAANPQKAAAARSVMQRTNYAATTMGDKVYLETASWGQNTPFNNQCFISYGSTTNAKTGCVPTAYAIIMRYHEWPLSGTGTLYNSQASTYVEITDRTYDYSKMPLVYDGNWSEEQINEVAKLMSHLGHAFMVTYGESSTSVSDPNSTYIPNKYFNYNLVDASYQKDFTINAWEEKIKESINNGCPIPYASDNAATGDTRHMFVLDGYTENDYFHFNFGWNGGSNGWFLLDAIKTSQGDDYSWQDGAEHYAIFNFTPNKTQYTVNASVSPTDAGTVSINGGETASTATGEYLEGATVTLAATANEGYTFSHWSKGTETYSTSKSCTAKVASSDNDYVANFLTVGNTTVNVSVTYDSNMGTVTGTSGTVTSGTTLTPYQNEEVTLTAAPVSGYIFTGWTVTQGTESTNYSTAGLTLVATGEMSVTANFAPAAAEYTITTSNIEASNIKNAFCSTWTTSNGITLSCTKGSEVAYALSKSNLTFYATATVGSSETLSTDITYTLTAPEGYLLDSYSFVCYSNSNAYTVDVTTSEKTTNVDRANNHTISQNDINAKSISFTLKTSHTVQASIVISNFTVSLEMEGGAGSGETPATQYTITASASPSTAGSVTGGGTYTEGATVTLTATPNSGYEFVNWTKSGEQVSTNATYSFNATSDAEYVANFQTAASTTYTVTTAANPAEGGSATFAVGTGQATTSASVASGTGITLYADANDGYNFINWTKSGVQVSTDATCNVTITEASNYVANFEKEAQAATEYPTATGTTARNRYLTSATTTGADTNISYTADAHPGTVNVSVPGTIQIEAGASFTLNLIAKSLGAGSTSFSDDDIRYCHASLFTDFDQDFTFQATPVQTWGVLSPSGTNPYSGGNSHIYGNYDLVMNIAATVSVPDDAPTGTSRIRVMYTDAWGGYPTHGTSAVSNGIVYDFAVEVIEKVDVTAAANPAEGGTLTINGEATGTKRVVKGTSVTLSATAADGYDFVNWTKNGEEVGNTTTLNITVNADADYTANFQAEVVTYTISVSADPVAAGMAYIGTGTSTTVTAGTEITLTAVAGSGYTFVGWYKNNETKVCDATSYTFVPTESANYVARFEEEAPVTYTISVSASPSEGGSVTGGGTYTEGATVTLTATPNSGYEFVNWTSGGLQVSSDATYSFTANATANTEYVANFEEEQQSGGGDDNTQEVTINTNNQNGSVDEKNPDSNANSFYKVWNYGSSPEITITSSGYTITANNSYINLRAADYTISVPDGFEIINYTINFNTTESSTVNGESYEKANNLTYTAENINASSAVFSVSTATTGRYIQVKSIEFTLKSTAQATGGYTISVSADEGGSATVAAAGGTGGTSADIEEGTEVTLTAIPESGYRFDKWTRGNTEEITENPYTFTPTESAEYVAKFVRTHTINVEASPAEGGSTTVNGESGSVTIDEGASITLVATPNDGYEFMGWEKDGVHIAGDNIGSTYALYDITYDATFTAVFCKITEYSRLEDGTAYKIRARMEDGSYHYVYSDGTGLKYSTIEGSTDSYIFVVQEAGEEKLNLISALGYYGWNKNGALGSEYAAIEITNGKDASARTLYSAIGTSCYTFATDGSNNIKVFEGANIQRNVSGEITTDFDFVAVADYTFKVSVANGSNAKLGTINLPFATKLPDGITAYKAEVEDDNLVMTQLELTDGILPANTPVLIEGTSSGQFGFAPAPASQNEYETGFAGTLEAKEIDSNVKAYILSYKGVGTEIKFYKLSSTSRKINANKAYFEDSTGSLITAFRIKFAGATGVDGIEGEREVYESIYDLQGRKIEKVKSPGIYIVDGKKKYIR